MEMPTHGRFQNLIGQTYGRLVVIEFAGRDNNQTYWLCKCSCGRTKVVFASNLRRGWTTSCGCLVKEMAASRETTHGMSYTPEYHAWVAMKMRCTNPKNEQYHRYGGRGITVCKAWLESFEQFFADMGKRPSKAHSLDRYPNNDGDYEPGNCRWAVGNQQQNNRRSNNLLTFNGQTLTITEWSEHLSIPVATLRGRLRRGWSIEAALTTPVKANVAP